MARVALCLHGIAKGKNFKHGGLKVGFEREAHLYRNNFIVPNSADVFIHSWSEEYQSHIDNEYKPIASLYEQPRLFTRVSFKERVVDLRNRLRAKPRELNRLNNIYSRWYSLYKVIQLLRSHENASGFSYDFVMVSRFDMSLLSLIDCSTLGNGNLYVADWVGYRTANGEIIDEDKIFSSTDKAFQFKRGFPHDDEGFLDFWFIASSDVMAKFSHIFLELEELVSEVGMSNHKIALIKIIKMGFLESVRWKYRSFEDFCLTRWM